MPGLKEHLKKYHDYLETDPIWMLILLPGFISYMLARFISDFGQLNILEQTLSIFGFSILSSILTLITYRIKSAIEIWWKKRKGQIGCGTSVTFSSTFFLLCLMAYSIAIGVGAGIILQKNIISNIFYEIKLLDTPSKESEIRPLTKLLYMNRKGRIGDGRGWKKKRMEAWVRVHMKSGEIFEGWPFYNSLSKNLGEIYLSPACIIKGSDYQNPIYHQGPGIFIYENEIRYLEFIDKSKCSDINTKYRKERKERGQVSS